MAIQPLSKNYVFKSEYVHMLHRKSILNIALTIQYPMYADYLMSFSKDSHQEIVRLYLLSRYMEEMYQHMYMDHML